VILARVKELDKESEENETIGFEIEARIIWQ